jgi:glucose/mannose-6-phosphate isomerase
MNNLDSIEEIKNIDVENVLGSIDELPNQVKHAFEDASNVTVPDHYSDVQNIIMCGMGGSGFGARIIESVYGDSLKYPLIRNNDYILPGYIDHHSLVICSSYSGETDETITNFKQALEKKCKLLAIGTGGALLDLAKENNIPFYKIKPKYNPSNQPRMAVGYSVIGQLVLASKTGLFDLDKKDIDKVSESMMNTQNKTRSLVSGEENEAKKLANVLKGKIIIFVSSEHMIGSTHTVKNQLNENAKVFSAHFQLPELNHHLMEGLKHPKSNSSNLYFVFIKSKTYSNMILKKFDVTKEVVGKNNIKYFEFEAISEDKLSQVFEFLQFGSYVNFYLSMLYDQNPATIPWVDYFKERLE